MRVLTVLHKVRWTFLDRGDRIPGIFKPGAVFCGGGEIKKKTAPKINFRDSFSTYGMRTNAANNTANMMSLPESYDYLTKSFPARSYFIVNNVCIRFKPHYF